MSAVSPGGWLAADAAAEPRFVLALELCFVVAGMQLNWQFRSCAAEALRTGGLRLLVVAACLQLYANAPSWFIKQLPIWPLAVCLFLASWHWLRDDCRCS